MTARARARHQDRVDVRDDDQASRSGWPSPSAHGTVDEFDRAPVTASFERVHSVDRLNKRALEHLSCMHRSDPN